MPICATAIPLQREALQNLCRLPDLLGLQAAVAQAVEVDLDGRPLDWALGLVQRVLQRLPVLAQHVREALDVLGRILEQALLFSLLGRLDARVDVAEHAGRRVGGVLAGCPQPLPHAGAHVRACGTKL